MRWLCGEDEEGKMEACADRLLRFDLKWFSVYVLHVRGFPHEPVTSALQAENGTRTPTYARRLHGAPSKHNRSLD